MQLSHISLRQLSREVNPTLSHHWTNLRVIPSVPGEWWEIREIPGKSICNLNLASAHTAGNANLEPGLEKNHYGSTEHKKCEIWHQSF